MVDDDPNLRKTLADILRLKGYVAVVAANGAEAILAAESDTYSVALIDLMLPDMMGLEVMVQIKATAPLTEVIILTGHASMDTAIEAIRHGAYSYLHKPYQMDDLLHKIKQAVELQQAQEDVVRLASFPRLDPSPVVELDHVGDVSYANPAAERIFPNLPSMGLAHALLSGVVGQITALRHSGQQEAICCESQIDGKAYELHISYVRDVKLIRIYVTDITERKRNEQVIQLLATTDSLTGLVNRHEFSRILSKEMARTKRYGPPLSLVMYDIDYFKRVNDSFGHAVGDYVLQAVTEVIKNCVRATDIVGRWGGEEFMVLMPHSDLAGAMTAADKLRNALADHRYDTVGRITASFGVTQFVPHEDTNALLKRADDALYHAKERGRNRIEACAFAEELTAVEPRRTLRRN
ncbi:MAG: hypothetical protein NVS4B5_19250 [Vulcanimicrobiaceae bacterium]